MDLAFDGLKIARTPEVLEEEEDCYQLQTLAGGMADAIKAAHTNSLQAADVEAVRTP